MQVLTLEQFIADRQQEIEGATGAFSKILRDLSLGAKLISFHLRRAALSGILGELGITNVQGESVQKLDHLSNTLFRQLFAKNPYIAGFASEEDDTFTPLNPEGKYVIVVDPLDGSSNIDVGVPVGMIFSIYRRRTPVGTPCTEADFLQGGRAQVAAGYILYGTSTLLFYTTGKGVHGFTLEPAAGDFLLSHPDVKTPRKKVATTPSTTTSFMNGHPPCKRLSPPFTRKIAAALSPSPCGMSVRSWQIFTGTF
jgi:fructose-1,6-bisphosphatase I